MTDEQTPDLVEIAGRLFLIECVPNDQGASFFACGILPMRHDRNALIGDIERSQGPEWRRECP